ncbi:hypothetical protein H072_3502 [Dactylellina haptotyla CBS 200.50]|uniref:Zn(2)-C6 fungal-type domain-containing protein n=1 Tax=Dactylellina haptotyla (strain CBS 200.50) TaxID=1284197 RepID=S8C4B6_DACHA|nr:hypothetical protein H072_3502 [Dactylellina haptotyla CBS 200.50]
MQDATGLWVWFLMRSAALGRAVGNNAGPCCSGLGPLIFVSGEHQRTDAVEVVIESSLNRKRQSNSGVFKTRKFSVGHQDTPLRPTSFTTASLGNNRKGSGVLGTQDPPGTLRGGGRAFFLDKNGGGDDHMYLFGEEPAQVDPRLPGDIVSPSSASTSRSMASFSTPYRPSGAGVSPEALHSANATPDSQQGSSNVANAADAAAQDPKRTRACESCRSLKVRCEPDTANPEGSCRRCAKARRECIFTVPTRKRQKRTDSRVAELEKKIDRLTATLNAKRRGDTPNDKSFKEVLYSDDSDEDLLTSRKYPQSRQGSGVGGGLGDSEQYRESEPKRQRLMSKDAGGSRRSSSAHDHMEDVTTDASPMFSARMDHLTSSSAPPKSQFAVPKYHARHRMPTPETDPSSITSPAQGSGDLDVIDRKLLTMEQASTMFKHYNENLAPHFPAVTFPAGTTAQDVRKQKPFLFLSILAAASAIFDPDLNRLLNKEVIRGIADRVIITGEKSLEIIQVLNIATLWYYPPDQFEELKFYQLTHIAAVMAIDCGINKPHRGGRARIPWLPGTGTSSVNIGNDCNSLNRIQQIMMNHPDKEKGVPRELQNWKKTYLPDPSTLESRRTFLTCYWMCSNVAMSLRRPNLLRYSAYMGECVEFIEKSPEATLHDKIICQWVKLQRITEEVGIAFGYEDAVAKVNLAETRIQFALKGFERQLEEWERNLPTDCETKTVRLASYTLSLFMHEVALHGDHSAEDFRPPFLTERLIRQPDNVKTGAMPQLTQTHINALFSCLSSAHGLLDGFLNISVDELRCLPVLFFARVAYSVVLLIKIYFSASASNSEVGRVIDKPQLKLDHYFEKLLALLKAAQADDKSKPAAKFFMILTMLNHWYQYQQRVGSKGARKQSVAVPHESNASGSKRDATQFSSSPSVSFKQLGDMSTQIHIPTPHSMPSADTPQPANDAVTADAPTPLHMLSDVATTTEDSSTTSTNPNLMNIDSGTFSNVNFGTSNVNSLWDSPLDENWMTNPLDMSAFGMGDLGFGMSIESLGVPPFTGFPDFLGGNVNTDNLFGDGNTGGAGGGGFFDPWPPN